MMSAGSRFKSPGQMPASQQNFIAAGICIRFFSNLALF